MPLRASRSIGSDKVLTENSKSSEVVGDQKFFENRIGRCKGQKLDPFLSPHEVAQYLGVSNRFVYERIARKEMKFQHIGRLRRIRLSFLENWLIQQNLRQSAGQKIGEVP